MISGSQINCVLAVSLLSLAMTASAHDASEFRVLMNDLAAVEQSRVAYTEVKYMAILTEPVQQSGVLEYIAPDSVIREIQEPEAEIYTISGASMVVVRNGKQEEIYLNSVPVLAAFVEAFRATLSGSSAVLEEHYEIEFRSGEMSWELHLQPRAKSLARVISSVVFVGAGTRVDQIAINEANGDHSKMQLTPLADEH